MVFRTSHALGPSIESAATKYHWDPETVDASYRLGNTEKGSDGHDYTHVQAASTLAANATFGINETTWQTTTGSTHAVPAALTGGVTSGQYFQARKVAL